MADISLETMEPKRSGTTFFKCRMKRTILRKLKILMKETEDSTNEGKLYDAHDLEGVYC